MNTKLKIIIFSCLIIINLSLSISALSKVTRLTIFSQNLALVEQVKTVSLEKGINQIIFNPVSKQIILDSVYPYAQGCQFLEERFIPPSTLSWKVESEKNTQVPFRILYLTRGIKWEINYQAELGREAKFMNLIGWAKVENESGVNWGPIQIAFSTWSPSPEEQGKQEKIPLKKENTPPQVISSSTVKISSEIATVSSESKKTVSITSNATTYWREGEIFYSLHSPINLDNNQEKRIWLFSLQDIPVEKVYSFDAEKYGDEVREGVTFKIEDGLNFILSSGWIYLYGIDLNGRRVYFGKKKLPQTLPGQICNIYLGPAKGILGERVQTSFREIELQPAEKKFYNKSIAREYSYRLIFYNYRLSPVKIKVIEHFYGQWEILESNPQNYIKEGDTVTYQIEVASQGEKEIYYKARTM